MRNKKTQVKRGIFSITYAENVQAYNIINILRARYFRAAGDGIYTNKQVAVARCVARNDVLLAAYDRDDDAANEFSFFPETLRR